MKVLHTIEELLAVEEQLVTPEAEPDNVRDDEDKIEVRHQFQPVTGHLDSRRQV